MATFKVEGNVEETVKDALTSKEIGRFYTNGFVTFLGQCDVGVIFQQNTQNVALVNMSYNLAKTLHQKLGDLLREFEEKTGNSVMTVEDIQKKTFLEVSNESTNNLQ